MMAFERILGKIAEFQCTHSPKIVALALLATVFLGLGIQNIRMETDTTKEIPQDLPVIELQKRVSDSFGGSDTLFLVVRIDHSATQGNAVQDIRDPRVMNLLLEMEDLIKDEEAVDQVVSIAQAFRGRGVPDSTEGVKEAFSKIPGASSAFNKDYSSTLMQVHASLGSREETVKDLNNAIRADIDASPVPPGIEVQLTGMPPVRVEMMDTLQKDAIYTVSLAAAIILALLLLINSPRIKGLLIFAPLTFGLIWTMGTMGWLNIPLSIATVGVGAMILGLGVEYGVFYVERYEEERDRGLSQRESMKTALTEVGSAIMGSSTTTMVGFLSLLLASMPMMHHLGTSLALGIFFCVVAALGINPPLMVMQERFMHRQDVKKREKIKRRIDRFNGGGKK